MHLLLASGVEIGVSDHLSAILDSALLLPEVDEATVTQVCKANHFLVEDSQQGGGAADCCDALECLR